MTEPKFPGLLTLKDEDIQYVKVNDKLVKGCDCSCHSCCVPMDAACDDCGENHGGDT